MNYLTQRSTDNRLFSVLLVVAFAWLAAAATGEVQAPDPVSTAQLAQDASGTPSLQSTTPATRRS